MKATYKAYQGTDRDKLINRLVDSKRWSHIGQVRASSEPNHIEVDVFFTGATISDRQACFRAQILGPWKLQQID